MVGTTFPIVALGERLRDNFGLTIREHDHFDPVDSVHAPNSYHYHGEAMDVQDWRDDNIDGVDWRTVPATSSVCFKALVQKLLDQTVV